MRRRTPIQRPDASLDPRIVAAGAKFLGRLRANAIEKLRTHYDLGRLAHHALSSPDSKRAMDDLAADMSMKHVALRRHARVYEEILAHEFEILVHLRDWRGMPLSWSHLERLSRIASARQRRTLARAALAWGWSVRRLSSSILQDR